ncbi:hypothetical protein DL89DRAFT_121744 [Linderina pennispora]|uniref:Uncharacterized protein n=1 Tax=Linderina pennispora TaxID=61395 RepID=A0A1Y1WCF7_9FUNG|nr:uncharacterized protein DL89DRAFT_121744 [Linderina pennispora]ORX71221.1 hypothetical protein DL89DRAFT_121744 [Linderina pennispora]
MGIAAIFKRPKATTSSGTLNDSEVSANRRRQAKRSSAPSGDIKQRSESKKGVSRSTSSAAKRRHRTAAQPIDDCEDLPTPDNSVSESNNIRAQNSALPQPNQQPNQQPLDNLGLSLYSIRTPPPDLLAHQMKELDPFADSPPPPALTNFEDPVYIPPLTLTETLAYEYTAPSQPATQPATAVRATASASYGGSFGSSKPALSPTGNTASGGMDLLSEFNATYNYLFGTLPPDTVATPHNVSALADGQFSTATNSGPTALSCQTKYHSGSTAPALSGLLSPVSDKSGKSNTNHTQRGAGKANARCDSDYASSVDEKTGTSVSDRDSSEGDSESMSSGAQRDEERRREDEERRAVEQRNRRREQLKQQVAFERMKERHRRQVVSPTSGPKSIARWQQDASMNATIGNGLGSGNDTFTAAQSAFAQDTLHASYGTINRGYVAGAIHHSVSNQGYVAHGGGPVANALYSNAQANASMPNVGTNLHDTQFAANQTPAHGTPMSPQRLPAMDPFAAATCARMTGQQIQQVNGIYYMMPGQPGSVPGPMLPPQAAAPLSTIPTHPEAPSYPVKLAMKTKKQSNPYLSDSSDDDDNDASSLNDSESNDSSVTGNLDYEYAASPVGFDKASSQPTHPAPLVTNKSESGSSSSDSGVITVSRTGSQPMLADDDRTVVRDSGTSDASSDLSNNSQSSSKRQVRFNETVSVVFNTRNSITEDDLDSKSAQIIGYESDNSSNASVEFAMSAASRPATGHGMATKSSLKKPALDVAKFANDDAFDAGNAYSSLRYQMPIDISPHAAAYWDLGDTATALNSNPIQPEVQCSFEP